MSHISTVEAGGENYNVVQASAVKQRALQLILSKYALVQQRVSPSEPLGLPMLMIILSSMPEDERQKVDDIVLHQVVKAGGDERVTIDNFQGGMAAYTELVAGAVKANLDDFFTWLGNVAKDESKPVKKGNGTGGHK